MGQSHGTERRRPLVGVSELIEQLRSLLANEIDLASDTPVEVLVGRRRYALVGTQAESDDDGRPVVTLPTALGLRCCRTWRMPPIDERDRS
jgi:hypothetical protein